MPLRGCGSVPLPTSTTSWRSEFSSSPSDVRRALEDLGRRLRELRVYAGLTGRMLAHKTGWPPSKISKIEYGRQQPSTSDIRIWCAQCHAEDQADDLIASAHTIEGMYIEWRRQLQTGLRRLQESRLPIHERTSTFRVYEHGVVPGLLQTRAYARALFGMIVNFREIHDDAEVAVAARLERQKGLHTRRRYAFVLEEQALLAPVGNDAVMMEQLEYLLEAMRLPSVGLGIIPAGTPRTLRPMEGFSIFDHKEVLVETIAASITITQPSEIGLYIKAFGELSNSAVAGEQARRLVHAAIAKFARAS